jgi:hypothetical protein
MKNQAKAPLSKIDWIIYKILLVMYNLTFLTLAAWNFLLANINSSNTKLNLINLAYLETKHGSEYLAIFFFSSIIVLLLGVVTLLNYRYDFWPPRYRYRYRLKYSHNVMKQTLIDKRAYGTSAICIFLLTFLVIIQKIGLSLNAPFYFSDQTLWLMLSLYVLTGIRYHILSFKLSKADENSN